MMDFLKPSGDEIIRQINPKDADIVLDVAAGTGEPGLTIATMLNGGKVIITDLSEDMLEISRENATRKGISNIETRACDVCDLPFADSLSARPFINKWGIKKENQFRINVNINSQSWKFKIKQLS